MAAGNNGAIERRYQLAACQLFPAHTNINDGDAAVIRRKLYRLIGRF